MGAIEIVLGIALLLMALCLIIIVPLQSDKDKSLSGAIAGGADTFFEKAGGNKQEKLLSKITMIVSIVFAVVVVAMYVFVS